MTYELRTKQCGNLAIFLPILFYLKSLLALQFLMGKKLCKSKLINFRQFDEKIRQIDAIYAQRVASKFGINFYPREN